MHLHSYLTFQGTIFKIPTQVGEGGGGFRLGKKCYKNDRGN